MKKEYTKPTFEYDEVEFDEIVTTSPTDPSITEAQGMIYNPDAWHFE